MKNINLIRKEMTKTIFSLINLRRNNNSKNTTAKKKIKKS